jgi:hypothetical protein
MRSVIYLIGGGIVILVYTLKYYFINRNLLKSAEIFSAQVLDLDEEIVPVT